MTVSLHEQQASLSPFGAPDQRTRFTANRVAIEKLDGTVVAERSDPRASFAGHELATPWDPLQRAYFNGYAQWIYLTLPFALAMPGFVIEDIEPWQEGKETWRGLRATFPASIASHSTKQEFYFGDDGLLRRHDYPVDVAGGFAAAQYVDEVQEFDGLKFPTRRRAYMRDAQGRPVLDAEMVFISSSISATSASVDSGARGRSTLWDTAARRLGQFRATPP
ncbi:hypothetical protein [Variovorax sp. HW608]|uniref:hypothetical protein n=1 Tax=Variovorax sp. HW608 TaxID=1034889 RepID=UPI0018D50967|nr:hypothetical protein [Variovorax sp. HW608]